MEKPIIPEEKSKKKKRQPYRRNRMGKRGVIPFLIPIIFIGVTILILFIIIKMPEICLFGKCWRLVPLKLSQGLIFWLTFAGFFIVQAIFIYLYWNLFKYSFTYGRKFVELIKRSTINVEKWFLKTTM